VIATPTGALAVPVAVSVSNISSRPFTNSPPASVRRVVDVGVDEASQVERDL
jgi:hypothetical protein